MPRVATKTKNRGGKQGTYGCVRCSQPIEPGQQYMEWSFRYGGTYRQHAHHGSPRRSQLTQSKLGEVYAAVEGVEEQLSPAGGGRGWEEASDLEAMRDEVLEVVEQVATEYEEAAENFGGGGPNQEQADMVREFVDALEQVDIPEQPEREEEQTKKEYEEALEEWRTDAEGALQEALDQAP